MVFAHILNITQQVQHHSEEVHKGRWANNKDFCFWDTPLMELREKKIGLVGLGNTGIYHSARCHRFRYASVCIDFQISLQLPPEIKKMDLDQLFSECDIISLHCPLTPEDTRNGKCTPFGYDEADSYFNPTPVAARLSTNRDLCRRFEQWQDLCSRSGTCFLLNRLVPTIHY